jgi:capsular exopolysaccharide synthesis family protein
MLLITIPAIAAVWVLPNFRPQYTARGEVRVRPIIPRLVFKTEETGPIPHYDSFLNTQVAVIYSPDILRRVLEQDDVKATEWYTKAEEQQAQHSMPWYEQFLLDLKQKIGKTGGTQLERLRKAIEVRPRGRTEIIDVSMTTAKGADAATVVNAVLDHYMRALRESTDQEAKALHERLLDEYQTLRTDIQQREDQIAALEEELETGAPEELISKKRVRLDEIHAQLEGVRRQAHGAELERQMAWRQVRSDSDAAKDLRARLTEELKVLTADIEAAEKEAADLRGESGGSDPTAREEAETPFGREEAERRLARLKADRDQFSAYLQKLEALVDSEKPSEQPAEDQELPEQAQPDFHLDPEWRRLNALVDHVETELELKDFQDRESERLRMAYDQARLELDVASETCKNPPPGPDGEARFHPVLYRLEKRVKFAKKQVDERVEQLEASLQKRLDALKEDLAAREEQLQKQWKKHGLPSPAQREARSAAGHGGFIVSPEHSVTLLMQADPVTAFLIADQRAKQFKAQEAAVQRTLEKEQAEFDRLFQKAQNLTKLHQTLRYKKELYEAVQTRLEQKRMEQQLPGSISILNRAIAPSEPSRDRRLLFSAMALFGALGAGVVMAFLRDNLRKSIREPGELLRVIHEPDEHLRALPPPFLETLPCVAAARNGCPEDDDRLLECVRMVRTTLLQRMDPARGNAIQVTSAGPEAGKSTVAILLARSLVQAGKRVLLVDADLRHPALAGRFGVEPGPGFVGALTGRVNDAAAILDTDLPGLDLLPAGRVRRGADSELITNGTFEGCLNRWRKHYEIVLFDSSPILPVADARILAQQVDATVLVAREKHCRRPQIEAAIDRLERCGGNLLGAVLITSDRSERYGGGYYYQYGEKYYSAATDADAS